MSLLHPGEIDLDCDGHVHTRLCRHAVGDLEEYVLAAVGKGLREIIFLEHFEVGINYAMERTWLTMEEFDFYHCECQRLNEQYGNHIHVGAGVEVGFNPHFLEEIKDFLSRYRWRRVGLSYHYFNDGGEHVNMLSRKEQNIKRFATIGHAKVLNRYFQDLLIAIDELGVDVLCHLDAPLRYCQGLEFTAQHWSLIDEILVAMKKNKVALEINTSGYAVRGMPFPAEKIIARARRFGLKFVAGSDAHRPQDVGRYFPKLLL